MRRECRERFPPPPISKETDSWRSRHASRHVRHARAVMHVGIAHLRWRGKRSRHSRRMRTRNFTYLARGPWYDFDYSVPWTWTWTYVHRPVSQCHRYGRPCEPAGSYDQTTRTAICFEHKTQYILICAPYTRIVVFWHISNIAPSHDFAESN